MKIRFRHLVLVPFFFGAVVSAQAQMCGRWTVTVDVVDGNGIPVDKAAVGFTDFEDGDVVQNRPFKKDDESAGRFVATFNEGDKVQREYNVLVKAVGYESRTVRINTDYCHNTSVVIGINPNKPKS